MQILDRHLPEFDVNEIHDIELDLPPETALGRILAIPVAPDRLVRTLFLLRGLHRINLPLRQFAVEVLGLEIVEDTPTTMVAVGPLRRQRIALGFAAESGPSGGCRLITETRVGNVGVGFRLYWLVVGPFSAVVRRRWLRAVAREV